MDEIPGFVGWEGISVQLSPLHPRDNVGVGPPGGSRYGLA